MSVGDSSRWQTHLVTAYEMVHSGVLRVWPECRAAIAPNQPIAMATKRGKIVARTRLEDPITRNLIRRLKLEPQLRGRFHIVSQFEIIDSVLDRDPDPLGYIDVAILFSVEDDEVCLALECKRLNVNGASLAGKYVNEGMMRFVAGQYVPTVPIGGMIGYVMDGRVEKASQSVIEQIRLKLAHLCCTETSILFLSEPDHFSTSHVRATINIELRHQLLAAS